jgi:hypothetical protein
MKLLKDYVSILISYPFLLIVRTLFLTDPTSRSDIIDFRYKSPPNGDKKQDLRSELGVIM